MTCRIFLPDSQVKELLEFAFGSQLAKDSSRRVRVLLSGTDEQFNDPIVGKTPILRIEEYNKQDMCKVIEEALNKRGLLKPRKPAQNNRSPKKVSWINFQTMSMGAFLVCILLWMV